MAQACPINFTTIDNTVSRIGSAVTVLLLSIFVLTAQPFWLYLLGADLTMRLYGEKKFSFVFQLSRRVQHVLRLPPRPVDGAAKHVAGHFGLLFTLILMVTSQLQLNAITYTVAAVYGFCLLMDVALDFCVGCKVYHFYRLVFSGNR